MLATRTSSLLIPLLLLGFGVGIPRYVAYYESKDANGGFDNYLIAGIGIIGTLGLLTSALFLFFRNQCALLFYGDDAYSGLIGPMLILIAGTILHNVAYSYYRGRLHMGKANLLQLINSGLIPPLVFWLNGKSASSAMASIGLMSMATTGVLLLPTLFTLHFKREEFIIDTGKLLRYSSVRVPGDFALMAIYSLPTFYAAHALSIEKAGMVAFSTSLVTKIGYLFSPISIILLPEASRLIVQRKFLDLQKQFKQLFYGAMLITSAVVLPFIMFSKWIIGIYLGPGFIPAAHIASINMLAAWPLAIYFISRSIIDAYYTKPVNAQNLLISLGVLLVLGCMSIMVEQKSDQAGVIIQVIAITVLGLLSFNEVRAIFKGSFAKSESIAG
jgi:O-antigen/teichoic acid export membrane protein